MERTLAIVKPDGVSRNIIGKIISNIEKNGLRVIAMKFLRMSKSQAKEFYLVHKSKKFYESLTDFMSSGPIVVMILEGENAIKEYRKVMGNTDFKKADEGTIRKQFATDIEKNIVHGSDSFENAIIEIGFFFSMLELMDN